MNTLTQKISEANLGIAQFLEWYQEADEPQTNKSWFKVYESSRGVVYSPRYNELPFHTSWEYFMDHVVAKIESLGYTFVVSEKPSIWHKTTFDWVRTINEEQFRKLEAQCKTKLQKNWLYAVAFIEWYTQK